MSSSNSTFFSKAKKEIFAKNFGISLSLLNEACLVTDTSKEDSGEHLISLHYNPDKIDSLLENPGKYNYEDIVKLASIRGIIYDLDTNKIIVKSYPKTACLPVTYVPNDTLLPIPTYLGVVIPTIGRYKKRYPGALLRSYYYNGRVRLSTHKKIDASNSFFGDSDKFTDIFMNNQTVFKTLNDLYIDSDEDVIHLFILNDEKLCVDSRDKHSVNKVVYLRSFSISDPTKLIDLTDYILQVNATTEKPIEICEIYTPDQVNSILSGRKPIKTGESDPYMLNSIPTSPLNLFSGGEMVIYEHNLGINSLVPESCAWRQKVMDGKINIRKLYIDSIADYENNSRGYLDIAFSPSDLLIIKNKILNEEEIDLADYQRIIGNPFLKILTNMIFIVPLNRLDECFNVYRDFDSDIYEAIKYIIERKKDIQNAIERCELSKFDAMSSGVKFREYIQRKMIDPTSHITGSKENWISSVKDMYSEYYKFTQETSDEEQIKDALENMGIISLISNAKDELLYSFVTYKNKVEKEKAAHAKRAIK